MSSELVTEDQVVDLVRRAMEQIHRTTAQQIALAHRIAAPRREAPQGSITVAYGTVIATYSGYCDVEFDTGSTPTPVAVLGTVSVGQRVAVMHLPPAGALVIGATAGTATSGGGVGGAIVLWELPGPVIPVAAEDSPKVPIVAAGTINGVTLALQEPPAAGMTCVVDVFLNGVSLFAVKPTLTDVDVLGFFALPAPVPVVANVDAVTAAVLTPAGRTLTIALS